MIKHIMLDRHLLRSIALQTLFEWDIRDDKNKLDINKILDNNLKEFAQSNQIPQFAQKIVDSVLEKQIDLDNIIKQAAPQWPIEKIPVVDRNILRIGIYELLFSGKDEVPPKVAINEAIELAKAFGGENSGKFISGVMGTIYKELGEPRKHETSHENKKKINIKDLPQKILAGAMVYAEHNGEFFIALTHNIFGYWTLIKGSVEKDESLEKCAIREVKEEVGLDVEIKDKLGENEYIAFYDEEGRVRRRITYFLAKSDFKELVLEENGGKFGTLNDIKWFKLSEIDKLEFYKDLKPTIEKGIEIIKKKII
ncbi:MAG: transcription antitermination factor NusB [Patescibacteria group bacterium]